MELDLLFHKFSGFIESLHEALPFLREINNSFDLLPRINSCSKYPYHVSKVEQDETKSHIEALVNIGNTVPCCSLFGVSILIVNKKDGTKRIHIDYHSLNKVTIKNRYPITRIGDFLDELEGSSFILKIDLRSGYHQIKNFLGDEYKIMFSTYQGLYELSVIIFGLMNAPIIFQNMMSQISRSALRKGVLV